jgi:hypothetical protein
MRAGTAHFGYRSDDLAVTLVVDAKDIRFLGFSVRIVVFHRGAAA